MEGRRKGEIGAKVLTAQTEELRAREGKLEGGEEITEI